MKTKNSDKNPIKGVNGQIIAMSAHRYALGRASYVPAAFVDWFNDFRHLLDQSTINVMMRDTVEYLQDALKDHGEGIRLDYHFSLWEGFAQFIWDKSSEESRQWAKDSVRHRKRPWPLKDDR